LGTADDLVLLPDHPEGLQSFLAASDFLYTENVSEQAERVSISQVSGVCQKWDIGATSARYGGYGCQTRRVACRVARIGCPGCQNGYLRVIMAMSDTSPKHPKAYFGIFSGKHTANTAFGAIEPVNT